MNPFFLNALLLLGCFCSILAPCSLRAFEQGDFLIRARGLFIIPNDRSGSLSSIKHAKVGISTSATPELDFTYMWTRNIGTELIAAVSRHKIGGKGAIKGVKVGHTWVLPPCLTLQYHFFPDCRYQPYLGVGINYSLFFDTHCNLEHTRLKLKNSWGVVAQAGIDILFSRCWFFNLDAKYVQMDTKARLKGAVKGHLHADIDPWILAIGVGRVF